MLDTQTELRTTYSMSPNMLAEQTGERVSRKPFEIKMRYKRQTLQDMTRPLKTWLYKHRDNPYPTKAEKMGLANDSNMTLTQVSNWFANARRRLKNTVSNPDLSWGKRVKMYNSCVKGNQELLSISSEDSAWESGDEENKTQNDVGNQSSGVLHGRLSPSQPLTCIPTPSQDTASPLSPSMIPLNLSLQQQQPNNPHISTSSSSSSSNSVSKDHRVMAEILQQQAFLFSQHQQQQHSPNYSNNAPTAAQQQQQQQQQMQTEHREEDEEEQEEEVMEQDMEEEHPAPPAPSCEPDCGNHGNPETGDHDHEHPPNKFKNSILQRYLQDSYQHHIQIGSSHHKHSQQHQQQHHQSHPSHPLISRHRNPSGSLSSHDYEDVSVSSRSTPTRDHDATHHHHLHHQQFQQPQQVVRAAVAGTTEQREDYEELYRQWPHIDDKANDGLHWKEISAALALTALSRGDFQRPSTPPSHSPATPQQAPKL